MSTQRPGMNVHGSVICNSLTETNINQQVNLWYIYTMEYYSAIQRNKLLRKKKSMNLRTVMLNEGSQTYDNHMHMIPYRILQNANLSRNLRRQIRDCLGMGSWGPGGWVAGARGHKEGRKGELQRCMGKL